MSANSQASSQMAKARFLVNINSEDSIKKSTNLLEEILGQKLDRLKAQKAVRESAKQANCSITRAQESKGILHKQPPIAKSKTPSKKQDDSVSIQYRTKTSPRQSGPSESHLGFHISDSLLRKPKSAEKDQFNITTQDGIRSERNSELFDIRVIKVPNGVMQELDSISQHSDHRGAQAKEAGEKSSQLARIEKMISVELAERDPLKGDLRRSVTETIIQEDRVVEEDGQFNGSFAGSPLYTAKARRTPTDTQMDGSRKIAANSRDKNELWWSKSGVSGFKPAQRHKDNEPSPPKTDIPKNKVVPASSVRGMLEFSDVLTGQASTENMIPLEPELEGLNKAKVSQSKDRPVVTKVNETLSSGDQIKGCFKKDRKAREAPQPDHEDSQSNRGFALTSPAGSKKGILTNKAKVVPNGSLSVYEMAGLPNRSTSAHVSHRGPKVRFAEKPEIREVESYKKYYKEHDSGKGCCGWCPLI